jgi:hypothetical protein
MHGDPGEPDTEGVDRSEAETDPSLPPVGGLAAGLEDDPVLGDKGSETSPGFGALPSNPLLGESDEDPVLGGLEADPALGGFANGGAAEDPAGMSFSAANEEPVADLADAPFGDSDPELGGFDGGPFGTSPGDELGGFAGEDPAESQEAAPEPSTSSAQAAANAASLEAQVIIKALAQLLVEKGVIGRDEFAERVRRLAAKTSSSSD